MVFTSDFPCGNGKMTNCTEQPWGYDIYFFAETKAAEPQPLWFYFKLSELKGEKIIFHLTNAACTLGGFKAWNDNRPVYRFNSEWKRTGPARIITNDVLEKEAVFEISVEGNEAEVAFCYPYGKNELEETIALLPGIKKALIGYSAMGRPIYRYALNMGDEDKSKKGIYIIARQHAGEVTGSYVMDGMLRYLATTEGQKFSQKYALWFVPFADADGVSLGWYGKDQIRGDLNRSWGPVVSKRPETRAITIDLRSFSTRADIKWVLDLHSPAHGETESYFSYDGQDGTAETDELKHITETINGELKADGKDPIRILYHKNLVTSSQQGYNAEQFCREKGWHSTVFECSYQGDTKSSYTIEDYRNIGRILLKAMMEV